MSLRMASKPILKHHAEFELYICFDYSNYLRFIISILLVLLGFFGFSQTNTEERSNKSNSTKTSNQTVMQMLDNANKISSKDAGYSMKLALRALEKSLNEKDKQGEYYAYTTLGTLYYNIGNYSRATYYFKGARQGFLSIKDEKGLSYVEKHLALSLEKEKKYTEAIDLDEEKKSRKKISKTEQDVSAYNKARLKSKTGKKSEAIKDLEILSQDSSVNTENKINIYKELGDLYVAKKDTANAFYAYNTVIDLEKNKKANSGFEISKTDLIEVSKKISDLNINSGRAVDNIVFQNSLLEEGLNSNDFKLVQAANYNIGTTYLEENREQEAIPYLFASVKYSKKTGSAIEEQKSVKELARAYENLGQYDKALNVYKRYVRLSDSFKSLQTGSEEENLALNQEFLRQEARIKGLMNTQKEKEASIKRQRNILWSLVGILMVFALLTWALVRNIRQKQKANMLVKLQSLRTQMNPHFIFNSLNSVNNFIAKSDERSANKYLSDFSKLMRTVLKNSDQDFVGLASEIETLGIYLDLEHFRFGDKFEFSLDVASDIELDSVQVPPMLIQPYIENAIWHGLRYKEEKGSLEVKFFIEGSKLFCTIYDNGIGRKKSSELKTTHQKSYQSTGIKNTQERIEILNKLHKTTLGIQI